MLAAAMGAPGGHDASSLRVAEQYVGAFRELAASGSTVVVPANAGDVGAMVAQAMAIYRAGSAAGQGGGAAGGAAGASDFDAWRPLGGAAAPPAYAPMEPPAAADGMVSGGAAGGDPESRGPP